MENKNRKKNNDGGFVGWIVIAGVIISAISNVFEDSDGGFAFLPLIIIVIVAIVIGSIIAQVAKKAAAEQRGRAAPDTPYRESPPPQQAQRAAPPQAARPVQPTRRAPEAASPAKIFTERKVAEEYETCEDEHYINLSPEERRTVQLKGMLKSGIIDREEYELLRARWGLK